MSGAKRRSGYRKTVESATLYGSGEPSASQRLAIVVAAAGSNLLRVRTEDGEAALALLPTRFRKVVWVKRGDALLLSGAATPASAASTAAGVVDGGVRFLVDGVLYPPQLAHLRATGRWPACLDAPVPGAGGSTTHGRPSACRRLASAITASSALRASSRPVFMVAGSSTNP